ncbi:polysaccharide pyruvyl transferase family protein [Prevotella sp. E9-3]|uniref:polysaccharide pyruvyl transferase family protein n=1 Tax=Prevotella sp. E9-3 TaxID=2913621 RepID=UPI001EDB72DD|nr:polysaccharide pyruvyl transferase family protein [Prevotella sp. E9-3]UKK47606.1 polysaccharide pyruvyl transferase family protein [Prevotella sp. E9-3]
MKIGIITYWQSNDNYGQLLQCWALQRCLINMGHTPFLIRFRRAEFPIVKKRRSYKKKLSGFIKRLVKILLVVPEISERRRRKANDIQRDSDRRIIEFKNPMRCFERFRSEKIVSSSCEYYTLDDLRKNPPDADAYITGSDQVWNYDLTEDELAAFFLQFGDKKVKRISYAPSIGHNFYPDRLMGKLRWFLSLFDAISVREPSGIEICKNVGFDANLVLDPTLLLSKSSYEELINDITEKEYDKSFFFIYSLNYSSTSNLPWCGLKSFAKEKNIDIVVTPGSGYFPCREIFNDVNYEYATIGRWLSLIIQAKLVITASFHGIVFCILHHKRFIYTPLKGAYGASNERPLNLIKLVGLENLIWKGEQNVEEYILMEIDWDDVDERLCKLRNKSLQFIINSLKS